MSVEVRIQANEIGTLMTEDREEWMRYMLLIYSKEVEMETMPEEEAERIREAHYAVMQATAARGIFRGAEPLKSTGTATTVPSLRTCTP